MRTQADHAGGKEMQPAPDLVPAEQQDGQETRFEKEGEDAFRRQRAAEHVAHDTANSVAQFVPNSNSITMPVATPIAKVNAKTRVQNRANWW